MTWHDVVARAILIAACCGLAAFGVYHLGYNEGYAEGRRQATETYKNECHAGFARHCFPGPGLIGTQRCQLNEVKNTWGTCEDIHVPMPP